MSWSKTLFLQQLPTEYKQLHEEGDRPPEESGKSWKIFKGFRHCRQLCQKEPPKCHRAIVGDFLYTLAPSHRQLDVCKEEWDRLLKTERISRIAPMDEWVAKDTKMRLLLLHHQHLKSYLTLIAVVYPKPSRRHDQKLIKFYRRMVLRRCKQPWECLLLFL